MDNDVLNAILNSYQKILAEISDIKKIITKDANNTIEKECKENKMKEHFMKLNEIKKKAGEASTIPFNKTMNGANSQLPTKVIWNNRSTETQSKKAVISSTICNTKSCTDTPGKLFKSQTKQKTYSFDPCKGAEIEKCLSQALVTQSSQKYFKKRSQLQEKHVFDENYKENSEFFNALEKEIEEAL
jgi:hypothetical protein